MIYNRDRMGRGRYKERRNNMEVKERWKGKVNEEGRMRGRMGRKGEKG